MAVFFSKAREEGEIRETKFENREVKTGRLFEALYLISYFGRDLQRFSHGLQTAV